MTSMMRKLTLTSHVTFSVGWLGAVAAFLVLSIAGLTSHGAEVVRSAYIGMDLIGRYVIVPLSLAALATGLILALGTEWGLVRYYWVLVKLVLTLFATVALLLHQFTAVDEAARIVLGSAPGTLPDVGGLGVQLVADAALGLLVLLVVTLLSILKPWGQTAYGRKAMVGAEKALTLLPSDLKAFLYAVGALVTAFIVAHLAGGGLAKHHH